MKIKLAEAIIVFDLDDTLYKEADYHSSGVRAVANKLTHLFGIDVEASLEDLIINGERDLWGGICRRLNVPASVKESILWEYRLHSPNIQLTSEVKDVISFVRQYAAGIAILTDGRAITQRTKLLALGLAGMPVYISEEFGASKPHPARFKLIEQSYPGKHFVYVGDNPKKDFVAPNGLGWITFCLVDDGRNIHSQDLSQIEKDYLPHFWLADLKDLQTFLC